MSVTDIQFDENTFIFGLRGNSTYAQQRYHNRYNFFHTQFILQDKYS